MNIFDRFSFWVKVNNNSTWIAVWTMVLTLCVAFVADGILTSAGL